MQKFFFIIMALINALFSVSGAVLFKYGFKYSNGVTICVQSYSIHLSIISMIGLLFYCISFLFGMFLVATNDLSKLTPIVNGFVFILTITAGYFVFSESLTIFKIAGIILILMGITLITVKG